MLSAVLGALGYKTILLVVLALFLVIGIIKRLVKFAFFVAIVLALIYFGSSYMQTMVR